MVNEWGIKSRVLFLTLVPTVIISLLLGAYFTSTRIQDLERALKDRGYAIALQLAPASEYGVFSGNSHTLQRIANDALSEPEVRSVSIFNKDGRLLSHAGHEQQTPTTILSISDQTHGITMADTGHSLLFTVPVTIRDVILEDYAFADSTYDFTENHENILGWISIELGRMTTTIRQYQVLFACSIIVLIGLGISGIFAFRMGRDVARPILNMAYTVEKIKNGNFDARVYTNAKSELRLLESGINTMAAALKAAHEEMQQSVEQATADLRQTLETIEIQNIELEIARKEAETGSRIKSEFLANMSHEIRTPLNGVIGFINLLMKTKLDPRQKDYITTIQKSAINLLSIINDILDFSKIEAGKLSLDLVPMDLRECVDDALTLMAPASHDKKLELVPMFYSDVPEKILGDHLRLKQIITNLVNNAIKFTEEGSVIVRIMLEKDHEERVMICISVTDSGIGLSPEEQKLLFQAFSQADATTTRRFGGTGLGLVISKRLVQQMEGDIGVESELGKGSTFWFTFYAEKEKDPLPYAFHPQLSELKLLVFESHPTTRTSLTHLLHSWNIQYDSVNDPVEMNAALLQAHQNLQPIDIVIIGVNQLDESNPGITALIKQIKVQYGCKIIVLANTTDQAVCDTLHDIGAAHFLSKPLSRKKLHDTLTELFIYQRDAETIDLTEYNTLPSPIKNTHAPLRILAVDDNIYNLKLVAALLENLRYKVITASSGFEALTLLQESAFDLILMDIQMPGMDGIEVTRRIRLKESPGHHIPIIALTAHAMASEREAILGAGMVDCLTKPIDETELGRVIERWTGQNPIQNEAQMMEDNEPDPIKQPVNWDQALRLSANNANLAKEMLLGLVDSLKGAQAKTNQSFAKNDMNQMREEVHRLHGACCYCGVPDLKASVAALESAIVKKDMDLTNFLLVEMNKEINRLQKYILDNPFLFEQNAEAEIV